MASISSNFIAPWTIAPESYQHIGQVIFSLCSLREERYGRIFGANLQTTLKNFKDFLEVRKKYHPALDVNINWHRYRWNDDELEEARTYFTELVGEENFIFDVRYAFFNDFSFYLNYYRSGGRNLSGYALEDLEHDFAWEKMRSLLDQRKASCSCGYERSVVITETGQLAQCCMVASEQENRQMGDILTMTLEDILRAKKHDPICQECKSYCLPYFITHWLSEGDRAVIPSDTSSCTCCSSCEE
ncbi:MAG: hypothetical protein LBD66_02635 [Holosporales bacterium]|nr:hypothetical protein [Holosporales bacterium]